MRDRRVVNAFDEPFLPYDMEGPLQEDITWLPVSWDDASGQGSYLMRMEPGAREPARAPHGGVPSRDRHQSTSINFPDSVARTAPCCGSIARTRTR